MLQDSTLKWKNFMSPAGHVACPSRSSCADTRRARWCRKESEGVFSQMHAKGEVVANGIFLQFYSFDPISPSWPLSDRYRSAILSEGRLNCRSSAWAIATNYFRTWRLPIHSHIVSLCCFGATGSYGEDQAQRRSSCSSTRTILWGGSVFQSWDLPNRAFDVHRHPSKERRRTDQSKED